MNPSLGSLSNDHAANTGVIVVGDGSTALIVLQQTALAQMCVQLKRYGQDPFPEGFEAGGLLMGPEPQNGDLLVEDTIPLGMGNRSGNSFSEPASERTRYPWRSRGIFTKAVGFL